MNTRAYTSSLVLMNYRLKRTKSCYVNGFLTQQSTLTLEDFTKFTSTINTN